MADKMTKPTGDELREALGVVAVGSGNVNDLEVFRSHFAIINSAIGELVELRVKEVGYKKEIRTWISMHESLKSKVKRLQKLLEEKREKDDSYDRPIIGGYKD